MFFTVKVARNATSLHGLDDFFWSLSFICHLC